MKFNFVALDFEFRESVPGRLEVVCLVAIDFDTGRVSRAWLDGLNPFCPPFPCGPDTILIGHAVAPAEARCWHMLGWPEPGGWIDTYVEAKVMASGEKLEGGFGLLACCQRHGISCISADEKSTMIELILAGGPYTPDQKEAILDYCESDVRETINLFQKQLSS